MHFAATLPLGQDQLICRVCKLIGSEQARHKSQVGRIIALSLPCSGPVDWPEYIWEQQNRAQNNMRALTTTLVVLGLAVATGLTGPRLQGPTPAVAKQQIKPSGSRNCKNHGSFKRWMAGFRKEAAQNGITRRTIQNALGGITFAPGIVRRDRRQSFFAQSFLKFSSRLISRHRLRAGARQLKKYARTFAKVRRKYGVQPEVITAFWALESDFGAGMGKLPVLRSLATLAYDCRRPKLFRPELMAALKIIDRGDLRASDMIGSWAGELGQTQFLPTHYYNHAVDFDGDGRRNLLRSPKDVIASTANFLRHLGWKRNQPWLQEVRIPAKLPWQEADLAIQHPRSYWARLGVRYRNGRRLPNDKMPASLLLPMGRNGPAFLAYHNFQIYTEWNNSFIYATTAAYFATRLGGAPPMRRGSVDPEGFSYKENKQLQRLLVRHGLDVGGIDGHLGAKTRAAIKKMQLRYGLPADSYPSRELFRRLRR